MALDSGRKATLERTSTRRKNVTRDRESQNRVYSAFRGRELNPKRPAKRRILLAMSMESSFIVSRIKVLKLGKATDSNLQVRRMLQAFQFGHSSLGLLQPKTIKKTGRIASLLYTTVSLRAPLFRLKTTFEDIS